MKKKINKKNRRKIEHSSFEGEKLCV